jgi:hypothetical protein
LTVTAGVPQIRLACVVRGYASGGGLCAPRWPGRTEDLATPSATVRLNGAPPSARRRYHAISVLPIVRSGKWPDTLPVAGHRAPGTELAGTARNPDDAYRYKELRNPRPLSDR